MHMQLSGCSWTLTVVLVSSAFTRATAKLRKMATRKVLTVDEVVEKLQYSDSDDGMSENDDSEDDFDGYLEEMEMDRWSNQREMDGNSDEEDSSDDRSNSDEDLNNSDEEMEKDVPPIPPYSMTSGCSATLAGNAPIDYFALFVDDCMLQHIVDQTILNSKQFMESHTLGQRSRI